MRLRAILDQILAVIIITSCFTVVINTSINFFLHQRQTKPPPGIARDERPRMFFDQRIILYKEPFIGLLNESDILVDSMEAPTVVKSRCDTEGRECRAIQIRS